MATLKLEDYNFSGIHAETTEKFNITPNPEVPELNLAPQEPFVVSEAQAPQEEEFNFTGLLQTKKNEKAVSSNYGNRIDPKTGKRNTFHDGIDIPLDPDTPLKPFGIGTVIYAGRRGNYGNSVGIDYGNGLIVYINHLNRVDVEKEDKVRPEALLGLSGNTGKSTGPHVHIQALKDGISIDPRKIFNEDPDKVGTALTIRGLLEDANVIKESSEDTFDFSGLNSEQEIHKDELDFSSITPITDNGEIDTDVIKFNPAEKQRGVGISDALLAVTGVVNNEISITNMAKGIASIEQFKFKPRTSNPNAPGKPITFSVSSENGQPPSLDIINKELAKVLNLSDLDNKYRGETKSPLIHLPNPIVDKNPDGTWKVTVPYGMSSGAVELINAYSRGGLKAFKEKMNDVDGRMKVYQEDLDKQKLQFEKLQAFRREHPYINLLLDPSRPMIRGAQDAALSELQLMHAVTMLGKALVTDIDSEDYVELMKEDAKTQIALDNAVASIPREDTILASTPRSLTSSVLSLPRFMAAGKLGSWALPTMTYVENLHRGNTEAAKAALPMALMVGSMQGIEKFITTGGNPLDLYKQSEIANKDLIKSIKAESPGNFNYHLMSNLEPLGIPIKHIDFKAITPLQRQLVLRGTNALVNVGTTLITNPKSDFNSLFDSAIIGLALPVGKGSREKATGFERRSILSGDAYTLPDGSILLKAGIDKESNLIGGRIQDITTPNPPSIFEERIITPKSLGTIEGKTVYEVPADRQLNAGKVDIGKPTKSIILPIDQAALNLLDLRRAYETGSYLQDIPIQTTNRVGRLDVIIDQKKQDLFSAIKILDEAIPKETQDYFAKNEALIRESIKTNYEDRIQKEEFVLGKKIIRKPASKLTINDVRPYNPAEPISRDTSKRSNLDNFMQTARRTMVSVEESGKRGLEANKQNKGTFNTGIDSSDIPYLVQIGIGKLGRKGLDAGEFVREMAAEHGEDFFKYGIDIYNQAKGFIDKVAKLPTDDIMGLDRLANVQTRINRAIELYGDVGKNNKWFTQEKQLAVREDFLSPPKTSELQEGFTTTPKWIAKNFSNLVQIAGFHVEDLYRRKVEPTVTEVVGRLRAELGDWVDSISGEKWKDIFDNAVKYYQSNNADPFFSSLKQNVLEQFPLSIKAESAKALLLKYGTKNEIEWTSGLLEWIDDRVKTGKKINKNELVDYIERNQIKVDEVVLGEYINLEEDSLYKSLTDERRKILRDKYDNEKNKLRSQEEFDAIEKKQRDVELQISKREEEVEKLNRNSGTKYDLKTYTSNRLELQGGRNPKEVLLQIADKPPKKSKSKSKSRQVIEFNEEFQQYLDRYDFRFENGIKITTDNLQDIQISNPSLYDNIIGGFWSETKQDIYNSPHWNEKNVVAHFRANERETIDGNKVFHSEEFQSDWNQQGRKEGYSYKIRNEQDLTKNRFLLEEEINETAGNRFNYKLTFPDESSSLIRADNRADAIRKAIIEANNEKIPQNPFMENNWKELAFKRFLRMGIEMGKDGVSWTTARQQQERYNKLLEGKKISIIQGYQKPIEFYINDKKIPDVSTFEQLEAITNKSIRELAEEKYEQAHKEAIEYGSRTIDTSINLEDSISIKGKGYSDYDTYFVNLAKKIGKKFGAEYKIKEIPTGQTNTKKAMLTPFAKSNGEAGYVWVSLNEVDLSNMFSSREEAIANPPDGYFYIDDAHKPIDNLNTAQYKKEQVHYLEITPQMRDSILKEGLPFYGLGENNPLKPSAPSGIRNKIITRDVFDSAKNEIVKLIQDVVDNEGGTGTVLNSGLNPDAFLNQTKLLYKGWNDFTEFSKSMTRRYGERISPHLENIWNYVKESTTKFNEDERGFLNFGKRKKLSTGEELDVFNDNRSSRFRNVAIKAHRGIALAQTYEPYGQVYETLRSLQRTTNAYSTTILEQLSKGISLIKKDTDQKTAKAIFARNAEGIQDPAQDAIVIARFGLNPEQIKAYHYIRSAISNNLDLQRDKILYKEHQTVANVNDQLTNLGLPTSGTPINAQHGELLTRLVDSYSRIQEIDDYFQGLKDSGYISLMRLGRYRAELENPNVPTTKVVNKKTIKNPDRFFVDYANSPQDAQKRINEWKEQHSLTNTGRILDAHNPSDFREMSRTLTPGEFEEIVAGAKVANTPEVEALRAEVYEQYPTMGYQLRRELYPGYKENNEFMIKSIAHQAQVYASSYYNTLGKEEGLRALENTGIEKTDKELWNVARQYIEDETSTPQFNNFDLVAYKARKFTYMMQLAHQFKQFVLNTAVQPITQNYSYLARIENPNTGKRLGGINEVERVFLKGTKLSLQLAKANLEERVGIQRAAPSTEYIEFESIYNQLKDERIIEPEFTKSLLELEAEEAGRIDSKFRSKTRNFFSIKQQEHWGGAFMRAGELATRTQMAASMFVAGKKFGLAGNTLTNFIVRGIDATQTNPTRGENPYYIRKLGEAGKLFYQFGAFRHMWLENLALNVKSDFKHRNISATSRTLAPMAIMAGMTGLPLSGLAMTLYGLTTGKNPDERLRRWVKRTIADNDTLENLVLYGNIGSASFSQSAGVQVPVVDNLSEQLTQDSWWDTLFSNNVPALLTFKQIGQGLAGIAEGVWEKDGLKVLTEGAKAAPVPGNKTLRDITKTNQVYQEGYETPSGDNILSRNKVTVPKLAGQLLGFSPNELSEFYQKRKYKKLKTSRLGKATRKLVRKF